MIPTNITYPRRLVWPQVQPFSLPILFLLFGMIMGSWAGRIPALREHVHVSHSVLSVVLLCGGLGAVLSFPITSRLMARFGGRKTMLIAGLALLMVLIGIGWASTVPLLMCAVFMLGITASCFDVAVNSVATKLEAVSGKSKLAKLHACGCAGGLVGASVSSLMASKGIVPSLHFMMLALPCAFMLWLGYELLDHDSHGEKIEKRTFCIPHGPLAFLGVIGFLGAMSEGSIADWSGVYLKDHFQASDGFAPLGLSAFSVMMLFARLCGDRLKAKYGARPLVTCSAAIAASGLFLAVFAPDAYAALLGFAIAGLGLSLVFPFVFSAAGKAGPTALAGVATMVYSGSLMGPPVIGTLAHKLGMQAAMGFVGILSVGIASVAWRSSMLK
jgi:MFS family permease